MVGSTLSHYRVVELLGRGGMGEVYAAEDLRLRRRIALKVLPPAMAADPERRRRFEREAQAIAALNHPGIVTIHSVEQEQGTAFLTMELVQGKTLGERVPTGGLPLADFLAIAIPLADAVNAAHERGILHRDLKPSNVMVTPDGRVKILDFGLAKLTEPSSTVGLPQGPLTTSDGQIVGTLFYMAPEQAEGKTIDQRADIFALGVMLYEMAAGVRPFAGETNVSILTSLLRDTARPVTELRRDLPPALGEIVQRCMEKDPAQRYSSAAQLRADLEKVRGGAMVQRSMAMPPWAYVASVVVVLLTGMGGGWFAFKQAHPEAASVRSAVPDAAPAVPVLITGREVAILDFENRTGDPSLDSFSRVAGEAIAAALMAKGLPVVSATDASAADGITIAAVYTLEGNEVRFVARLLAASRGIVIRNIDPVSAPRGGLVLAADEVQRRVVSGVLASLDPQP